MAEVTRQKEMSVARTALYKAITDFEAYPEFLGEVVSASIHPNATPEVTRVDFELEIVKRFKYTLEFKTSEPQLVEWKLIESNFFKTNRGAWKLSEVSSGVTAVNYELEVSFGFLVPKWVAKKLTEVNLPKMFDSFETRAMKLDHE